MRGLLIIIAVTLSLQATGCYTLVKNLDRSAFAYDYQKIAWLAYKHKKKREYIARNLAFLSHIRDSMATERGVVGTTATEITSALPTVEQLNAEIDAIAASNKANLSLLNLLIYRSIKQEIKELYEPNK